jgi:hypothetical protein
VKKEDLYAARYLTRQYTRNMTIDVIFGQTGKELLLPELPLKLRLIGLRVTKLKDLRAPASPPGGIKKVTSALSLSCEFFLY